MIQVSIVCQLRAHCVDVVVTAENSLCVRRLNVIGLFWVILKLKKWLVDIELFQIVTDVA